MAPPPWENFVPKSQFRFVKDKTQFASPIPMKHLGLKAEHLKAPLSANSLVLSGFHSSLERQDRAAP